MAMAPDQVGIGIRRFFTRTGQHPYDTVAWERRDARIPNYKQGGDAFYQADVEFPVTWSQNATNIVAQKYFRGQLNSPEREWSLRQVIDRVADTIADWGERDGYFVDEAEAEAFRDELKYLLVHQRAAFNSPVWFNIGVRGVPRQASACFILAVEDTMSSILNWYVEEGTIFKGGSGSGINLSTIRSSLEPLAGGGTASGPVSFMRGADASAGTIKCLHADTEVTTDHGSVPIRSVAPGWRVLTRHGLRTVTAVHDNGTRALVRVRTALGDEIVCTPEHRFRVRGPEGEVWREAGDLGVDDYVVVDLGQTDYGITQRLVAEEASSSDEPPLPGTLDEAFAVWLGWAHGEGRLRPVAGSGALAVHLDGEDQALVERYRAFTQSVFGREAAARTARGGDAPPATVCPPRVARFLQANGLWRPGATTIPRLVRSSPATVRAAFLAGLFESDGHVQHGCPTLWTRRPRLALEAHRLLLSIGIPSKISQARAPVPAKDPKIETEATGAGTVPTSGPGVRGAPAHGGVQGAPGHAGLYRVRVVGDEGIRRFAKLVGFVSEGKARLLEAALDRPEAFDASWFFPHVDAELARLGSSAGAALRSAISSHRHDEHPYGMSLARAAAILAVFPGELDGPLARFALGEELYVPVTVEPAGEGPTVDLTVKGVHEYLVHQVVTHNSGGKTRRAAKMVILNVDHPDVEQFIWCKAIEERKARALAAAGFDMDLDGADSHSTQYQNANNSVRVTDEFMEAVVADRDWKLRAVTTGEPLKTVPARSLMRQIAEAAWECADPGMQFDTTINRWHTAANTGRINASNPCSEYMHLDNSACNLASLNLLTFLDDDGSFDVEGFKAAVEVIFTAQEILVSNADYPTEKIAEVTRAFRQLGLGYANLGALLMAQGLPYDSDQGRAWAGAITALMTGHAYATSARTAARMGPFAGYAENEEPTLRVLRMHRAEVDDIDAALVPDDLLQAAQAAWDEAVDLAETHGVRNSQASVLAPTGCLVGGSLVATDRGLVRLRSLGDPDGPQWQQLNLGVLTDEGARTATHFYVNGLEPVVEATTRRGYRIQGTTGHRVRVVDQSGQWVWRRFADLRPGDVVPLALGQMLGESQPVWLPPLGDDPTGERVRAPRQMTPQLAELVGYFMGDGSLHARGLRLCVSNGDHDVVTQLEQLAKELFGIEAVIRPHAGYTSVEVDAAHLAEWWEACGFAKESSSDGHRSKGFTPHVPDAVLHSNDTEVYRAFLRGLFEADGTVTAGYPSWTTTSADFSHDVQTLLLALGFVTTRSFGTSGRGSHVAVLRLLHKASNVRWLEEVGFISGRKARAVDCSNCPQSARYDHVPVSRELIDRLAPANDRNRKVALLEHRRGGGISRRLAEELYAATGDAELGRRLGFFYDRVASAELGDEELTYDLSVPENVTYVANGFVSHNTIGLMMDCDTTGIEPDLALTKAKKLVGGGTMFIVNQTIPRALRRLGYTDDQVSAIVKHIDEHKTILGAPGLRIEDLPVFACAMGDNPIHYMGHVKMMAAVQPFISGAISKCVVGETLISTVDGLVRIGGLYQGEVADSFRDEVIEVASLGGTRKTDAFYYGGVRAVREIILRSGHRVIGTPNHRVLVAGRDGLAWRRLDEVSAGEYVGLRYGADLWSELPARLDSFVASTVGLAPVTVPVEMTAELAFLLGAFAAAGRMSRERATVTISHPAPAVLERLQGIWRSHFGVEPRLSVAGGRGPSVTVTSPTVVEFLDHLGAGDRSVSRRVPDCVLISPREMVVAYLEGVLLASRVTRPNGAATVSVALPSSALLDDLQAILSNLGVLHARVGSGLEATGDAARRLLAAVPLADPETAAEAAEILATEDIPSLAGEILPSLSPRELYLLIPPAARGDFAFLRDSRARHASRRTLEAVAAIPGVELPDWLRTIVADGLHFSPVDRVADAGERKVFDLSVPLVHAFVGNGIVNHNTINMPEEVTVEEVEDLHVEAWRLGLKAIAIYRDNCKVAQPLSTQKAAGATSPVAGDPERPGPEVPGGPGVSPEVIVETIVLQEPVRKKLPRKRNSKTFSFRVADCHGYVTVGEYEDGRPGEIFLKVAKQGSTLAGIMDAFAISVSHGLQYGVPLKAFADMFINMRFEPAGITDDPEIRLASSLVDYIFRRLAVEYLSYDERVDLGILTVGERSQPTLPGVEEAAAPPERSADLAPPSADLSLDLSDRSRNTPLTPPPPATAAAGPQAAAVPEGSRRIDAPYCYNCGMEMQRAGSCYVCSSCGATSGCS